MALTFTSGTLYGLSLPHMLDQRTVGLQFSYNLKPSDFRNIYVFKFVIRNDSWTRRVICKLDHLWYASGKDQTNRVREADF